MIFGNKGRSVSSTHLRPTTR